MLMLSNTFILEQLEQRNKGDVVAVADTLLSPIHLFSGTENGKAKYKDVKRASRRSYNLST